LVLLIFHLLPFSTLSPYTTLFRSLQPLQGELVGAEIHVLLGLELVGQPFDQPAVEVFAAEEGIPVGGFHFEHAVADLQDRDVERSEEHTSELQSRENLVCRLLLEK